jgi:hypothetical protein
VQQVQLGQLVRRVLRARKAQLEPQVLQVLQAHKVW